MGQGNSDKTPAKNILGKLHIEPRKEKRCLTVDHSTTPNPPLITAVPPYNPPTKKAGYNSKELPNCPMQPLKTRKPEYHNNTYQNTEN